MLIGLYSLIDGVNVKTNNHRREVLVTWVFVNRTIHIVARDNTHVALLIYAFKFVTDICSNWPHKLVVIFVW